MFIGREKELKFLQEKYESNNLEIVAIYGRKRIGKTALLREFSYEKSCLFYICTEQNLKSQLFCFSKEVAKYFNDIGIVGMQNTFHSLLKYIADNSKNQRLILVLDEFQNLFGSHKHLLDEFTKFLTSELKFANILLILTSSNIGFVENELSLSCTIAQTVKLNPLTFNESLEYLEDYSDEDKIKIYSITGGFPYYMDIMDPSKSFEKNIVQNLLNSYSELFEENRFILLQELRELSLYNGILESIANR